MKGRRRRAVALPWLPHDTWYLFAISPPRD